ncbi:MAG: hypothetical protein JO247_16895 [Chloroflexi bacterium]|nr:hypothetical protein [Chloroflexota bacterium]
MRGAERQAEAGAERLLRVRQAPPGAAHRAAPAEASPAEVDAARQAQGALRPVVVHLASHS